MQLITDRTEADVLLGNAKGQYSYEDLNRVEQAVAELCSLAKQLDIHPDLTTKIDWGSPGAFSADSWPTESQLKRYLQNVNTLCDCFALQVDLPATMENLNFQGANSIEESLEKAYQHIQSVLQAYKYSGDFYAGEEFAL